MYITNSETEQPLHCLPIWLMFPPLGQVCRSKNVFFHSDAAQAIGKIPINVSSLKVDLMSISGHKIYGPKGIIKHLLFTTFYWKTIKIAGWAENLYILEYLSCDFCKLPGVGALYVRRRPRVRVEPLQSGGGQERGLRSGTVPTPLAVGLGTACEIAQQEMEVEPKLLLCSVLC